MESTCAHEFDRRLAGLIQSERHLAVQFVVELARFAKQQLYRELGYTSLFYYCVRQLGLSKASAFRRSEAASLIARFPAIADRLTDRRLTIRALVELREVLTEQNHAAVLARAEGKTPEEAQLLAVEIRPKPIPRDLVRTLVPAETKKLSRPAEVVASPAALVPVETKSIPWPGEGVPSPAALVPVETKAPPCPRELVKPLTPALRRLNVTVSAEFIAELEQVRAALSHKCPDGEFEQVVREAFRLVLERDRKRKALTHDGPRAQRHSQPKSESKSESEPKPESKLGPKSESTPEPRSGPASEPKPEPPVDDGASRAGDPRYVPAVVRRAVWTRDGGRCTWPMGDGRVCGATHRLELDHDLEVALGGKPTIDNIRLLCRGHNLLKAEEHLGRAFMARFRKGSRRSETS